MKLKTPSDSETIMTEIILPNEANPMGIVQGGRIVHLMDIAAAICAQTHTGKIAVTASIDKVRFVSPARVGDVLTIKAVITKVFSTSMEIYTEVTAKRLPDMKPVLSNSAFFTFVALGEDQKPTAIPKIKPVTAKEKQRYKQAEERKEQWKKQNS